jgi:hypothetical protein
MIDAVGLCRQRADQCERARAEHGDHDVTHQKSPPLSFAGKFPLPLF